MDLAGLVARLDERLTEADADLAARYPGARPGRQPVHTLYVPAHRFHAGLVADHGRAAQQAVAEHEGLFRELIGNDEDLLHRVRTKLETEPVEDLRIDFEDGYGDRGDTAEDEAVAESRGRAPRGAVRGCGAAVVRDPVQEPRAADPRARDPHPGVVRRGRRRGRDRAGRVRGDPAQGHLGRAGRGDGLPLRRAGARPGARRPRLEFELQVETPQAVVGPDGTVLVAPMIHAADGRCTGLHYGTYDYSASIGIPAAHQSLDHPSADVAKTLMQAAAAGTGVRLSDGSTNVLPVGDEADVRRGWETHLRLVRRSLQRGFYQGWDLHPHQLPTRYAATFAFFREGLDDATARLAAWAGREIGPVADEPATVKALAGFLVRGVECGALTEAEVTATSGHDLGALADLARPRPPTH